MRVWNLSPWATREVPLPASSNSILESGLLFYHNEKILKEKTSPLSLVAQTVKNLPAMRETCVQSLDWEDPLEKGTAAQLESSCLENSMDRGAW